MPQAQEKTDGGIIKATQTVVDEETSNICGFVLKLGTEAYGDEKGSQQDLGAKKVTG